MVWPSEPQQKTGWFQGQVAWLLAEELLKPHLRPVCLPLWAQMPCDTGHEDPLLPLEVDLPPPGPPRSGQGRVVVFI